MKSKLKNAILVLLAGISVFVSCKKEYLCENCGNNPPVGVQNKPPIAKAGADQTITLPIDSVLLDGSASTDPDGSIKSFNWEKISGPASFKILNADSVKTKVSQLVQGVYQFELNVTDNKGTNEKDTVQIIVNDPAQPNRPPVANAGNDQTTILPTNTAELIGSASTDPDNNITNYTWTKISGPPSFNIVDANAVQTQVTNLVQGIYQFELKVTDAGGLFSKDTIQAIVQALITSTDNGILVPFGTLSIARAGIASASAGNKILFAGGFTTCGTVGSPICNWFSRVDIYDMSTHVWSTAELSQARIDMGVAVLGNKIFFAGGYISSDNHTSRVDIYDAGSNTWSIAELSEARINPAGVSLGNKIYFGGGCPLDGGLAETPSSRVDVYDATTNTWSTAELSEARTSLAAASLGNKILFAGGSGNRGFSKKVDSYSDGINQWSIDSISEVRSGLVAATVSTKAFFAGGWIGGSPNTPAYSNRVDIFDNTTQSWSVANLSQPAEFSGAASDATRVLFFPYGTRMEIYNSVSNNWYFSDLIQSLYSSSVVGAGGQIYVAGGALNNNYTIYTSQVWYVQF
jgi:hypothetical protein